MSDDYGYPLVPLHEVVRRITDGSHFSPTPRDHGHLIANVKDMKAGAIDFSTCTRISPSAYRELKGTGCTIKNGNVLLSKDGTVGRVVVYRQDDEIGALSSICIIEPTDRLDAAFLGQALQSEGCTRQYDNFMSGSALRRLVLRDIRSIQVPLPDSEHQRAISQVLDTLDTAIHETEAIIAKLKAVKQGLLHDLLTRGIAANGELRPPQAEAPHLYKESPLGWIPKEWDSTDLGAITTWASGGTPNRAIASNWIGDVPLLTPKDMKAFELSDTSEHINLGAAQSGSRLMPPETVFIVVRGMILAHSFPVVLATRSMAFNQDIKAVSPGPRMDNRFLAHWFVANSDRFLRRVTEATHGTKKLDMESLLGMSIGLPPLAEQDRIVARQKAVDDLLEDEASSLSKLQTLKAGLMDDLLTGRVRVTPLLEAAAS